MEQNEMETGQCHWCKCYDVPINLLKAHEEYDSDLLFCPKCYKEEEARQYKLAASEQAQYEEHYGTD